MPRVELSSLGPVIAAPNRAADLVKLRERRVELATSEHWHPQCTALFQWWCEVSPPTGVPVVGRIAAPEWDAALPDGWMLDVQHRPQRLQVRWAGPRIAALFSENPAGRWLDEAVPKFNVDDCFMLRCAQAVVARRPIWRIGEPVLPWGKPVRAVETLIVPFATTESTVDLLLLCTLLHDKQGDARAAGPLVRNPWHEREARAELTRRLA
jgi:hypothetical protein